MPSFVQDLISSAGDAVHASGWFSLSAAPPPPSDPVVEYHDFAGLPLPLTPPDGSGLGVHDTRTIQSSIEVITDVDLWIQLDNPSAGGAFNGDFYATLTHDSGFTVLLNRAGVRGGPDPDPFGYPDNGFAVTFDDQAANGDIHLYRLQLPLTAGGPPGGSHSTAVDPSYQAALSGTWAPDGRDASPLTVSDAMSRTRLLSEFNGMPASGQWTLFVADLSAGGTAQLRGWGLQLTGFTVVPEPAETALCAGLLLALAAVTLHRRTR